jgi:hypothetical protein
MLRYETHQGEIDKIFNLINTGRFYSFTFIKKGDGQLRYLNGKRHIYVKPDGTEGVVKNIGYDPKNHNLIRIWDRNALNPITNQKTGNYRSAALENILFIKSGSDIFDFIEENQIVQRFPYIARQIPEIKAKMKIEDIVDDEAEGMIREWGTEQLLTIADLGEYMSRVDPNLTPEDGTALLQQEFQTGGDEAVVKMFKEVSLGTDLQILGRGKYAFKF